MRYRLSKRRVWAEDTRSKLLAAYFVRCLAQQISPDVCHLIRPEQYHTVPNPVTYVITNKHIIARSRTDPASSWLRW